jgi:hypothetical protein
MMKTSLSYMQTKQVLALLLGLALSIAIFITPYQLHYSLEGSAEAASGSEQSEHAHHHRQNDDIHCLRCILYGFQLPEILEPLLVVFVVLGFLKVAKPAEPFSFITLSKSARAPPLS